MLKLKAALGEAVPESEGGRGKKLSSGLTVSRETIRRYRKLAANRHRFEEYRAWVDEQNAKDGDPREINQRDFAGETREQVAAEIRRNPTCGA